MPKLSEFRDSTRILNWLASFHIFDSCIIFVYRSSRSEVFCKKVFLEISKNSQENTCARVSFLYSCRARPASMCNPSAILDFCFILVASNTVIWASLFGAHRFKLEVENFIFHVVVFSRETFQTLAWKFLLCVSQKVFGAYIFPNFVLVWYIVAEKLVKTNSRRVNTFSLFLFAGGM